MSAPERPGKITTVIVDDEPLARSNLAVLLRLDPEIEIVAECGSGVDALRLIRNLKPDLLFLDVQMPECDGFDVLELLGNDVPPPSSSSPPTISTHCAPSKPERSTTS